MFPDRTEPTLFRARTVPETVPFRSLMLMLFYYYFIIIGHITEYSMSRPVSTGMGDCVRVRLPEAALYFGM